MTQTSRVFWNCFFSVALSEVAFGKPKSQWNNHPLQSFSIENTVPPIVMEVFLQGPGR